MSEGNGVEYRFRRLEDSVRDLGSRVENIDANGSRRVGVLERDLTHLATAVEDLGKEVKGLRNTVIGAVVTVMLSAIGVAITMALTSGP